MRSRDVRYPGRRTQTTLNKVTGAVTTSVSAPQLYQDALSVVQDQLHGNHTSLYPHEFLRTERVSYQGFEIQEDSTTQVRWDGVSGVPPEPDQSAFNTSVLYNSALGDMLDQLRSGGVGSGLDIAVDIAEGHQTARMIRQVGNLVNYVRSFHPRQWANRWLEYQYGWRPMVESLYGTFDALMHRRSYAYARWIGKSWSRSERFYERQDLRWPGSREELYDKFKSRCMVVSEYQHNASVQAQLLGYTTLNPSAIVWELMPYSFVVDWLIDIGGYLRSMEASLAYRQQWVRGFVVYGYKAHISGQIGGQSGSIAQNNLRFGNYRGGYIYRCYKLRDIMFSNPMPRTPQFSVSLGWQRVLSSVALLRQHLPGRHYGGLDRVAPGRSRHLR